MRKEAHAETGLHVIEAKRKSIIPLPLAEKLSRQYAECEDDDATRVVATLNHVPVYLVKRAVKAQVLSGLRLTAWFDVIFPAEVLRAVRAAVRQVRVESFDRGVA